MSETADIIEAQIEKFDALRETLESDEARCFLLKRADHSGEFEAVLELTGGWYQRWNEYRQATRIAVATLDESFADQAAQSSYFAYGIPDADGAIDVYRTEDDQRDRVAPNGANPYWKFYVLRQDGERFTITDAGKSGDDEMPYKIYTASVTQSGTDAPQAVVFENTIGEIVWSRSSQGIYRGTLAGAFPEELVAVFVSNSFGLLGNQIDCYRGGDDFMQIQTQREVGGNILNVDNQLGYAAVNVIEIRVYEQE